LTRLRLIPSVRMGEKAIRFDEAALREWIQRGGVNQANSVGIERNGVEQ
jgi:hypothetical protein